MREKMDLFYQIDGALFEMLSGNHQTWSVLVWFGIICAKFLIYIIPLHIFILWFCGGYRERRVVLSICTSICFVFFLSYFISLMYFRPRPFVANLTQPLIHHKATASFPSHHALVIGCYAACLYFSQYKIISKFALMFLFLICWGRVFTGVHYPFDVLVGAVLGSFVGWSIIRFVSPYFPGFLYKIPPLKYNFSADIYSK